MPDLIPILDSRPVTTVIGILNFAVSIAGMRRRDLYHQWILHPYGIRRRKEFWRLITSDFIHHDLVHLLINSAMLFFICGELEMFLSERYGSGSLIFLAIYLLSHLTGAMTVSWSNRNNFEYSSAGASGSIMGCMMSFMILAPHEVAFYLPLAGAVENEFAALLVILGLMVYRWRSGNEMLDNELHFFSALGGIAATVICCGIIF
ncbi:rhomboid family intramembrane serine protease [Mucilaginibacter sp. UR6-1]|uniref:rhomboid family intramembrane serine protease n=1 Tax=Mucilaginibacter sp. UR6-1 TaxID=1435643 RepID=UPI001E46E218|nr:rhomboid family intramembrane serine protease [Mucilaginibacter sp. UR6-1]MCC8407726.1 rhomboid family intramembrane serine protease [Mucilaginibacter sp. UR6-1]